MLRTKFKSYLLSFIDFASPRRCEVCGIYLGTGKRKFEFLCDECYSLFPPLPDSKDIIERINKFYPDDDVIDNTFALFPATENSQFMELIYSLKYRGFSRIGVELGYEFGKLLKNIVKYNYDFIIPVPIHHARLRERGFNQSEMICKGINLALQTQLGFDIIKRARYTRTQTQLSAEERRKNVEDVFVPKKNNLSLAGKNILLVDDVFTTGSTLFHCAKCLNEIGASRIDTATLVFVSS